MPVSIEAGQMVTSAGVEAAQQTHHPHSSASHQAPDGDYAPTLASPTHWALRDCVVQEVGIHLPGSGLCRLDSTAEGHSPF